MSDADASARRFPLLFNKVSQTTSGIAGGARPMLRPQLHMQQAAEHAARKTAPTGLGLDSAGVRQRMVQRLRQDGLSDERVLQALSAVQRHLFVDSALATQAYEDTSLPIGHGQTISKPSVVGRMIALLLGGAKAQRSGDLGKVLEIGTGCGYQAAVLAALAREVVSIERLQPLHDKALKHLAEVRRHKIRLVYGDGRLGHRPNAPYDSIIAAAGGEDLPAAWLAQLAPGGRLIAPMTQATGQGQVLIVVDHVEENGASRFVRNAYEAVHFVPLKSGVM